MINTSDREHAVKLIQEAVHSGARLFKACEELGIYLASESSFYKVLREAGEMQHRGYTKPPVKREISTYVAVAPNQVWMWDITYLNGPIKGTHYYLYLISDLFSRKIVGWEVWEEESAEHASELIRRTTMLEKSNRQLRYAF